MRISHSHLLISAAMTMVLVFSCVAESDDMTDMMESLSKQVENSPHVTPEVAGFIKDSLIPLCHNEVFVREVTEQNAKAVSLDEIKKIDKQWTAAEKLLPIHEELTHNACAVEILRIAKTNSAITEMFVMDNQGANVGQNVITSDYWQGDEPKWQNSFNGGAGGVDLSEPELDKSTLRTDQKVSLPIVDTTGAVIGAVCVGIAY